MSKKEFSLFEKPAEKKTGFKLLLNWVSFAKKGLLPKMEIEEEIPDAEEIEKKASTKPIDDDKSLF